MTVKERTDKIRDFLSAKIGNNSYTDQDDLFGDGLVDSLFAMELLVFVEKEFDITVKNEDLKLKNFKSVYAISSLVDKLKCN